MLACRGDMYRLSDCSLARLLKVGVSLMTVIFGGGLLCVFVVVCGVWSVRLGLVSVVCYVWC